MITIHFYGAAKDAVGQAEIKLSSDCILVENLIHHLISHYPTLAPILNCSRIILDSHIVQLTDRLPTDQDFLLEILPPFSGG